MSLFVFVIIAHCVFGVCRLVVAVCCVLFVVCVVFCVLRFVLCVLCVPFCVLRRCASLFAVVALMCVGVCLCCCFVV